MNQKLTPFPGSLTNIGTSAHPNDVQSVRRFWLNTVHRKAQWLFVALICCVGLSTAQAQISVTVTNGTNTTPNLSASYASLAAALTDLNAVTAMSGPVTLTLSGSETAPVKGFVLGSATLNPVLSATNTITLINSGTVTINAGVGTSSGPTASPDGMFILNGADHVTIDGITFTDGNTTNATVTMEFGLAMFKRAAGDGCNNNTIQNCTFNMQRVNVTSATAPLVDGSVSIGVYNSTFAAATTGLTPTNGGTLATNGTNSGNRFYTNTINGGNNGIAIIGFAATVGVGPTPNAATFLGDLSNDIGGSSSGTGNIVRNYGGGTSAAVPAAGIRGNNQWSINISYNTVNNNNGSGVNHPNTLRGIFAQAGTSANGTITNNNVTINGGGTTHEVNGIDVGIGSTAASNTVTITNNTVTGSYNTATSGAFRGINSNSTASTVNANNNTVQNITYSGATLTGTGTITGILLNGAAPTNTANNNTVNNITRSGATGGTTIGIHISSTTAGIVQNANNNTVSNISIDGAGTASIIYGIQTAAGTVTMNNNQVNNLTCTKTTGTGALYGLYNLSGPVNENYNNNTINNLTHNGTGAIGGILVNTAVGTRTCSNNVIHTITGAGLSVFGMSHTTSSPNVFGNKIYNIESTSSAAPIVSGIIMTSLGAAGTGNIYNNLIGDLRAPNASSASAAAPSVRGINITVTTISTNIGIYNNSVYLEASSSGTNFATTALFVTSSSVSTTASLTLRNNVLANNSTPAGSGFAVAYQRSGVDLANYNSASNNNAFYAGSASPSNLIFYDGTNSDQDMSTYQTRVASRDAASFSENVTFQSTTGSSSDFLKIDLATATQIESGGLRITSPAITTDYFGTIRALETGYLGTGSAPDIGAFEGNMTGLDLVGPSISYTALTNTGLTSSRTLNVTITDPSGVPTTGLRLPRLFWRVNNGSYTDVTATHSGGSTYSFSFGAGTAVGDTIRYYVVAQDAAAANNVSAFPSGGAGSFTSSPPTAATPPTTPSFYVVVPSFQGTYNVGAGETYTSLTDSTGGFFRTLNQSVVTGNIIVEITSNITETGQNALNQVIEEGAGGYTITIRPSAASMRTLSGTFAGGLIRLNGADRVTFDGRFSGSGTFFTFGNTNAAANSAVFQLRSTGVGEGCTNVTIRNTNISAGTVAALSYGISASGTTIASAGADHDNLTITDNVFTSVTNAVYATGSAAVSSGALNNVTITRNSITASNITVAGAMAIRVGNAIDVDVSENSIDLQTNITGSTSPHLAGISIEVGASNTRVSRNDIVRIQGISTGTGLPIVRGIVVGTASATSNVTIDNNVIRNLGATYGTTNLGSNVIGILVGATGIGTTYTVVTGDVKLYYNSVNLTGNVSRDAATVQAAIFIGSGVTSLDIRNNALSNSITNTNASGSASKAYAIYSQAAITAFTTINNNSYFVSGTQGVLAYLTSDRAALGDIQTAFGQNANSITTNPLFNSATNLRPQLGSPLLAGGSLVSGISIDFLGNSRSGSTPAIGAYESGIDLTGPTVTFTALANTASTASRNLTASITDPSGVPTAGAGLPVLYWSVNNAAGPFTAATATHTGGSNYQFNINATVTQNDRVHYYIVAQDELGTPNVSATPSAGATGFTANPPAVSTPPTTPNSYRVLNSISGTIQVGVGQTFTSLTANNGGGLFRALNDSLVATGNLTIEITSDLTETGAVFLNQIAEDGAGNYTYSIVPSDAVLRNITGTNAGGLVRFNAADRIVIDGRHGGSGSFLRFANSNTGTSSSTIWFNSITGNGATNNTVRNCIVEGNGTLQTLAAILVSGGGTAGGVAEAANSNFNALNNTLRRAVNGIAVVGPTGNETGLVISGNTVGSTVLAEKIGNRGIAIFQQNGASVRENTIFGITRSTGDNQAAGIAVLGTQLNSVISRNIISDIRNTSTGLWGCAGIALSSSSFNNGVEVSNNVISDVTGLGEPAVANALDNGHGITITNGGGYRLHFNTVNLTTNQTNNGITAALFVSNVNVTGLNITNNIFVNSQTNSTRRAIYSVANDTSFTAINHNLYRADTIGFIGAAARIALADWQTATGKDANSITGNPLFTSSTDMRPLEGSPVFGAGTPVAGITVDYLGNTRSVSAPSIGAYESALQNIWNGTGLWTNAANWSLGVPAGSGNGVIGSGTIEVTAGATINNITVNSGATVTIPNAISLTVNGALTNNGTFTVQNGGHLLQGASATIGGSGTFSATRNSANTSNLVYNMWSSPNSTSTLGNLGGTDWYLFNSATQAWSNTGLTSSSVLSAGRGYSSTGAGNVTFTGTFNNGAVSPEVGTSGQGWNLVGNPYPSSVSGTSFLAGNTNIDGTLWFWSQPTAATLGNSGGDYATWTTAGGTAGTAGGATPDGNIGLAQGFFVKANSGSTVSFTNSMRSANAGANFRLGGERAWFNLTGGNNLFNQILLGFSSGASDQRDPADGTKLKGNTQIAFYSLLGADHLAIQAMAERGTATRIVPVGFDVATAGAYSLALDRTESMPANVDIFLKDNLTGSMHNLRNQAYGFAVTNAGSFTNRFEIHFGVGLATSVNNLTAEQVRIFGAGQSLFVQGFAEGTVVERFEVRDAAGRLVMELNRPQNADLARMEMNVAAGVYLACIVTNNGIKTERVYLSK
ncbi:MAG: hypothetical protein C0424_06590 [Sphingobacteriaceae bacterium]|nr:hypothetical protein [Sphingobacteriaceae bacterium]